MVNQSSESYVRTLTGMVQEILWDSRCIEVCPAIFKNKGTRGKEMEWAWQVILFALRCALGILAIVISMAIFLCVFALLLVCLYLGIAVSSELYDIYIKKHLAKLRERYERLHQNDSKMARGIERSR